MPPNSPGSCIRDYYSSKVVGATEGSITGAEPFCDGVSASLIQRQMQLRAAKQEILRGHGILDVNCMDQLSKRHAGCDLPRESRIEQDIRIKPFDLVAIGEGPAMTGFPREACRALRDERKKCGARLATAIKRNVL